MTAAKCSEKTELGHIFSFYQIFFLPNSIILKDNLFFNFARLAIFFSRIFQSGKF